ncbi:MAG TPA: hypothetical protein VFV26_09550, partial [Geothrix sp.]|nr:hypothetical protein [Geothrix sp.]
MFALGISDFSIGEGVYPAKQLLSLARQLGYRDLVCWDRGVAGYPKLRGALEWIHKSRELEGLPPDPRWTGFRLHLGSRFTWRGHAYGALPFTDAGYAALNRLLSAQAHEGAVTPIPGLGEAEPPQDCVLLAEDLAGLDALLREGFYAALLGHPRRAQEARKALAAGLEVVAPQVLRFRTAEGLEMHRLKRAIDRQTTLIRTEALWDPAEAAVPRADWEVRFPFCEAAVERATAAVLERLSGWNLHWGGWVLADPLGREGADLDGLLREKVQTGMMARFKDPGGEVVARMERELDLISFKGFARYFLLVEDIVRAAQGAMPRICGRGSGAASLVSYALGLSNVDPLATNLMFERFLTKERKDPPDMDIDFAWDEREDVIQKVFERYGRHRVAMVANHAFFKAKGA